MPDNVLVDIMQSFRLAIVFLLATCAATVMAQTSDNAAAIRREHWLTGIVVSGGTGLFDRTDVQFTRAGLRIGRVLTGELGKGSGRGTFELDAELMPVDYVLWRGYRDVYGFSVTPLVLKWNFTRGHKTIPYILAQGGMLHTKVKIPPGNTSTVNFVTGPGVGFNHFLKPGRSISFDVRATHLSNGSLGDHNPGVNASIQCSIGFNWWQQ